MKFAGLTILIFFFISISCKNNNENQPVYINKSSFSLVDSNKVLYDSIVNFDFDKEYYKKAIIAFNEGLALHSKPEYVLTKKEMRKFEFFLNKLEIRNNLINSTNEVMSYLDERLKNRKFNNCSENEKFIFSSAENFEEFSIDEDLSQFNTEYNFDSHDFENSSLIKATEDIEIFFSLNNSSKLYNQDFTLVPNWKNEVEKYDDFLFVDKFKRDDGKEVKIVINDSDTLLKSQKGKYSVWGMYVNGTIYVKHDFTTKPQRFLSIFTLWHEIGHFVSDHTGNCTYENENEADCNGFSKLLTSDYRAGLFAGKSFKYIKKITTGPCNIHGTDRSSNICNCLAQDQSEFLCF